jgi:hypothetical protein
MRSTTSRLSYTLTFRFINTLPGSHPHINMRFTCTQTPTSRFSSHKQRRQLRHSGSHPNQKTWHFGFLDSQTQSSFTPCAHCKTCRLNHFAPRAHCRAIKLQLLLFGVFLEITFFVLPFPFLAPSGSWLRLIWATSWPIHVHVHQQLFEEHMENYYAKKVQIYYSYLFEAVELELPCFPFVLLEISMLWLWKIRISILYLEFNMSFQK